MTDETKPVVELRRHKHQRRALAEIVGVLDRHFGSGPTANVTLIATDTKTAESVLKHVRQVFANVCKFVRITSTHIAFLHWKREQIISIRAYPADTKKLKGISGDLLVTWFVPMNSDVTMKVVLPVLGNADSKLVAFIHG